ncbi:MULTISPECIES: hypothetical protein [unclassified Caballeronia]|uniref:hypothetical protein n=1 Tax=unclassified Caballeronia TaxID=2646786 RepID=UPI002029ABAA|nr:MULTISPECIES: hypothetical protein [unclassified Caballeronia]
MEWLARWAFSSSDEHTADRYAWRVRTGRGWMKLLAAVARPIFEGNHDYVSKKAGKRLRREAGGHWSS